MPAKFRGKIANRFEIAEIYGKSVTTIDDWVRQGCPIVKVGSSGVAYEFNTADVWDWRVAQERSADGEGELDPRREKARKDTVLHGSEDQAQ